MDGKFKFAKIDDKFYPVEIETSKEDDSFVKPNGDIIKNSTKTTFKKASDLKINDIKKTDIKKYLKFMYENANGEISPGMLKIAKNTGLKQGLAKDILGFLKHHEIIGVVGANTHIFKSEDEVKKMLKLNY